MKELLKLCGFEKEEIESELPRVKKVFNKLGITDADIEVGKQRLNKYFDIELEGIRKAVGLNIREMVNTVLAREDGKKKIFYGFMCPGFEIMGTALTTRSKDIYVAMIPFNFEFILGGVFDKITPIIEAGEQKWLKAGKVSHCANIKTLVGLLALDLIPKPDLIVASGQLCDAAPKTLDILEQLFGVPTYTYDTVLDRDFKDYPDASRSISLIAKSLRWLCVSKIQDIVGFEITEKMIWESIEGRDEIQKNVYNILTLLENSDPVPISLTLEMPMHSIAPLPLSIPDLQKPKTILKTIYEGLKERIDKGKGVVPKGAPRILSLIPHHFSDPRLEHLICEVGLAGISSEIGFYPIHGTRYIGINLPKPEDPFELIGRGIHSSLDQSLSGRITIIIEACKRLNIDGVLGKYHVGCRIGAADAFLIKEAITRKLGIPVLLLEWEGFDPRVYDDEQFRKQLELFKETLKK